MPAWVPSCSIAVDRWRNRLERRRDTEALPGAPGGADARAFVRELALERHGYRADARWEEWLHRALRAAWPCRARERFAALWTVGQQEHKAALFGVAVRPLESASGS